MATTKNAAEKDTVPHNRIKGAGAAKRTKKTDAERKEQAFKDAGAVVLTVKGKPDMRIKENRLAFMKDETQTVAAKPDQRFFDNRPDLQEIKAKRNGDSPNLLFTHDGELTGEKSDNDGNAENN